MAGMLSKSRGLVYSVLWQGLENRIPV